MATSGRPPGQPRVLVPGSPGAFPLLFGPGGGDRALVSAPLSLSTGWELP